MIRIWQQPLDFQQTKHPSSVYPDLYRSSYCRCSWAQLVWAAITVGKGGLRTNRKAAKNLGYYARFEKAYRSNMLYANLLCDRNDHTLRRTSAYDALDRSEKSAMSYFFGLTIAKLLAERYVDTPWLTHFEQFERHHTIIPPSSPSRPDLVGATRGTTQRWVLAEAKGRTVLPKLAPPRPILPGGNSPKSKREELFKKAKAQLGQVTDIDGASPHLCFASAVFSERAIANSDGPGRMARS